MNMKPLSNQSQIESYDVQSQRVKILCNQFDKVYFDLIDSHFGIGIDIKQYLLSDRSCRNMSQEKRKKILLKGIGGTKSLAKPTKSTKKQSRADVNQRHIAEKSWNEEFYNDLSIQLKFHQLVFVDPRLFDFHLMYPDSQDYVRYHTSEAYFNMKKKDPTVKSDLTHFVAITDKANTCTRKN